MFSLLTTAWMATQHAAAQLPPGTIEAVCHFQPTTQTVPGSGLEPNGSVMYIESVPGLPARIDVQTNGMTPGPHGIHIHDFGDLSDTTAGTSTGVHYNPLDEIHGCYPTPPGELPSEARKVGDMGNVIVNDQGAGFYSEDANELIFLEGSISVIGRGTIVHALEDNCVREEGPGGDLSAGARIGFCVIGHADPDDSATHFRRAHRQYFREQYALAKNRTKAGRPLGNATIFQWNGSK
jgi:Cu-Zn family superoxide dismutase